LGCQITVPDFSGLSEADAEKMCQERGLVYQIKDTAYVKKMPKRSIVDQIPPMNSKVKKGRTIYFTINSDKPPLATLQNLSQSLEGPARKILENDGFIVELDARYEPDPAEERVIKVEANGEEVKWGTRIPKGTRLTLVLGDGSNTGDPLKAPEYRGWDFLLVKRQMGMSRRVLGRVDSTSLNGKSSQAIVYDQNPKPGQKIKPSDPIDIWITDPNTFKEVYEPLLNSLREQDETNQP